MKTEIITKLQALLQQDDISAAVPQIKNIQREYENAFEKEMETAKQTFVDEGGRARDFIYTKSKEDETIISLFEKFRQQKKQHDDKIKQEQEKNWQVKIDIIRDINDLAKLEANISGAIKKFHELQAKYKETGNVPLAKRQDLTTEYNRAVDIFYHGVSLYKESQEVDFKKNLEVKELLLEKIEKLRSSENIKEVERNIKQYRRDWEKTGAVPQEKWAEMRDLYKKATEQITQKIQDHYANQKEHLVKNLDVKKQLVEKAKQITASTSRNEKEWEQQTKALLEVQEEYKEAGHTEKELGDEVWKQFRGVCDAFFEQKKDFYEQAKERYNQAKEKKQKLIDEASVLKDSTDWQKTSEKIIQLQQRWKQLPNAHPKDEHKMYERFRELCNHFFEAKRMQFAAQNAELEGNVQQKEILIQNLLAFSLTGNAEADSNELKKMTKQWYETGLVPQAERKRLNDAFFNKIEELYGALSGNENEKQLIKYKLKLERFENSDNPKDLLMKENDFIKKQINEIQQQANVYENNMGFFKHAKTKNPMMIELENKIAAEKAKIDDWKKKQALVRSFLEKLSKPVAKES
ncbi:MAG: DUF349 domain-containing protein [Bacteroidetes bacterium]|nr:DUF349 domain-containing protein [Bacteroidota bacterium]